MRDARETEIKVQRQMKKSIFGKIISKIDLALVYKTKTKNKFLYWSFHPGIKRS